MAPTPHRNPNRKAPGQTDMRRAAERRGRFSEWWAALSLWLRGYRIVALRHKTRLGEIDIIARKGDLAVFVEVKARRDAKTGIDAVSATAHRRIRAAADLWQASQPDHHRLSQRFDIVVVSPRRWPMHFPDAF